MVNITAHPEIEDVCFIEVQAKKQALYAAVHALLQPHVIDLLHIDSVADLTMNSHDTGVYLGVHDPTIARQSRLFFVTTGVFHVVLVHRDQVWSSSEDKDDLRPIRGICVPGGVAVGFQGIHNNRSSYLVLGHRDDEPQPAFTLADPLIADHWQRVGDERVRSVITGERLP